MVQRVVFGAVAIIVVFSVVVVDVGIAQRCHHLGGPLGELLRRGSVIPVIWLALVLVSAVELARILRLKGVRPFTSFAYGMIALLVLTPWISAAGWMGHGAAEVEGLYWLVVWLLVAGVGTGVCALNRASGWGIVDCGLRMEPADGPMNPQSAIRNPQSSILNDVGATWLMIGYLGFFGAFALQLRSGRDAAAQDGAWLLLLVVLVTKASDIGAYFVGSRLGRRKLCPLISPGKTVEGAIGGLCAGALVAVLFVVAHAWCEPWVLSLAESAQAPSRGPWSASTTFLDKLARLVYDATRAFSAQRATDALPPALRAALFGLAMSAAAQLGDLVESSFKRDAGIKDSGKVIPRFGGILDLMDSPLFAVPIGWFLFTAVWNVV